MNTSHGWIKLYRCLLEDAVCQKSAYFHLWVTLLLMAAHKEHEFIFNNEIHKLRPGQLITGRKKLAKLTKIPEMTIEHILKLFVNSGRIQQQKNNKFRIITITKWEKYQNAEIVQHQIVNNASSNQQPVVTYKNDKNEKNLSLREEDSFNDNFTDDNRYANDPIWQDTERKLKEYENEQRRIQAMLQRTNP